MATVYPPDGFKITGGDSLWDDDVIRDAAVYKTGESSVKFKSTTPSADPYMEDEEYYPCAAGDLFRVESWVRASRRNGTDKLRVVIWWYTGAKAYISATTVFEDIVDVINTWELKAAIATAPATAAYFLYGVGKDNVAFDAWFDSTEVVKMPVAFEAKRITTGQTINHATTTKIQFNSENYDYGAWYDHAAGYDATAQVAGLYHIRASAYYYNGGANFPQGKLAYLSVYINAGLDHNIDVKDLPTTVAYMMLQGSGVLNLSAGDVVDIRTHHSEGVGLTVRITSTRFAMAKVE